MAVSGLEVILALTQPARHVNRGLFGILAQHPRGVIARRFNQISIALKIGKTKQGLTRLTGTEKLTGPALTQIVACDLEAIRGVMHNLQSLASRRR